MEYNEAANTYSNKSGVEIKASGFGDTCKVEYLITSPEEMSCTWQLPVGNYFHTFVDYFVDNRGYQRGKSIRAAPYDWRLAAGLCQLMNAMCVGVLHAIDGFARSIDCAAPSMDPLIAHLSVDRAISIVARSIDDCAIDR